MRYETANIADRDYYNNQYYLLYFGSYGEYCLKVYGSSDLQAALEVAGKYCREKGYNGLIDTRHYDDILAECDGDEDIFFEQYVHINGGEYYLHTPSHVSQLEVEEAIKMKYGLSIGGRYRFFWRYGRPPGGWTNGAIYTVKNICGDELQFVGYNLIHNIHDFTRIERVD